MVDRKWHLLFFCLPFFCSFDMPRHSIKWVAISVLLVLFGMGTVYIVKSLYLRWRQQNFSSKLASEVEKKRSTNNVVEVRLKELTDFEWERVYLFTPYTPHKVIDDDLGFVWKPARKIHMDWRDDVNLIVFTDSGKVVFFVEHQRNFGDFDGAYKREGYGPDEAVFEVTDKGTRQPDGRAWLRLQKRNQY